MIDIVLQMPDRFCTAVKAALERELPSLRPTVIRSRFGFREKGHPREIADALDTTAGAAHARSSSRPRRHPK
jgi:LacI family transcriptional regulator